MKSCKETQLLFQLGLPHSGNHNGAAPRILSTDPGGIHLSPISFPALKFDIT